MNGLCMSAKQCPFCGSHAETKEEKILIPASFSVIPALWNIVEYGFKYLDCILSIRNLSMTVRSLSQGLSPLTAFRNRKNLPQSPVVLTKFNILRAVVLKETPQLCQ